MKIALGLCLFLTLTPFIGFFIYQDSTFGKFVGNFTPYIHFTMPELGGFPFAEALGGLIALCIFLVGLIGIIIFAATKFKKAGLLLFLLYMTIIYCGFRLLGVIVFCIFSFSNSEMKTKLFVIAAVISDILWGAFCYWAANILSIVKLPHDENENTHA